MGNDRPGENVVLNKTVVHSDWHFKSNQSLILSTDVMLVQLTLTLKMTTTQVVQTSDTVINNSPIHNYSCLDDRNYATYSAVLTLFLLRHFFKQILYCFFFFCSNWCSYKQLFVRNLTSAFSYIKFECFSLYFKLQVLLVDTNTGTPLPFGTLGVHKVLQRL